MSSSPSLFPAFHLDSVTRLTSVSSPYENQNSWPFRHPRFKTIFDTDSADPVAKGTWSTDADGPVWESGMRRYGASKLCQIMMMYTGTHTRL